MRGVSNTWRPNSEANLSSAPPEPPRVLPAACAAMRSTNSGPKSGIIYLTVTTQSRKGNAGRESRERPQVHDVGYVANPRSKEKRAEMCLTLKSVPGFRVLPIVGEVSAGWKISRPIRSQGTIRPLEALPEARPRAPLVADVAATVAAAGRVFAPIAAFVVGAVFLPAVFLRR